MAATMRKKGIHPEYFSEAKVSYLFAIWVAAGALCGLSQDQMHCMGHKRIVIPILHLAGVL